MKEFRMPDYHEPPPPLPLAHRLAAILLADAVAAVIFVGWLYGPLFFGDNALRLDVLPSVLGPYLVGGLLPSFLLVRKAWHKRQQVTPTVWFGVMMSILIAIIMAFYAAYLSGENVGVFLVKLLTPQFFVIILAGALSGAAVWYYLDWARPGVLRPAHDEHT